MSNAAETALAYVETSTFGELPTGTPKLKEIPFSSESLKQSANTTRSENINPQGRATQPVRTSYRGEGDIQADFVTQDFDDFIRYACRAAAWSSAVTDTDTIYSMDNADNSINRSGGSFITDGFTANGWVKVSGFTDSANNGYFKIVSVAALKMVLSNRTNATEAAGDTVTVTQGAQIVDGTTTQPIYIEKEFRSNTNDFAQYPSVVSRMSLGNTKETQIKATFGILAQFEQSASATLGDGANTVASGNEVLNTIDHIISIQENGVEHDLDSFTMNIDANLEGRNFLTQQGITSIRRGFFDCNGEIELLYKNGTGSTFVDKALNFTSTSLVYIIEDPSGNAYVFDIPNVKITQAERVAGGNNQDVIVKATWAAEEDVAEDTLVRVVKF